MTDAGAVPATLVMLDPDSATIRDPLPVVPPAAMLVTAVVLCHYCAWRTMATRHGVHDQPYSAVATLWYGPDGGFDRLDIHISGPPEALVRAAARGCRVAAALKFPVRWTTA